MSFLFAPAASAVIAKENSRKQRRKTTVKDGGIVARFFNPVAGRPYPSIGTLTDSITVQMRGYVSNFLLTSTTVPTFNSILFTLSSLGGYVNYTALFDQYHIQTVEVWLEPATPSQTNVSYAELASCVDLDDSNTPATIAAVADHPGALLAQGSSGRYHKWVPHIATASYSGAFTSFQNEKSTWIDSASPSVQHYGFKVAAAQTSVATAYNLCYRCRVSFRAPGIG